MHLKKICVTVLLLLISSFCYSKDFKAEDVIGFWLTKEETAVIQVYKNQDKFVGKIVWLKDIYTGKVKQKLDKENPDEKLRSRSILGLKNLDGFEFDGEKWVEGSIYDPKSGKTYSAKMTLEDINELHLRGFIGISLFGRTSVWKRQNSKVPDQYLK